MALKKETNQLSINEAAELYVKYAQAEREAKRNGEKYKKILIQHAKDNKKDFENKVLTFPNGLKVIQKETEKIKYNPDKVSLSWINDLCSYDYEHLLNIGFEKSIIEESETDEDLKRLLTKIEFETEKTTTYAINTKM